MTNSCRKGKRGEREAAAEIRRLFGTDARRSQQHAGSAGDADLCDEAIPGYHVEVKNLASVSALKHHRQAARDAKDGRTPIVVIKGSRTPWYVILTLEDFARSMGQATSQEGTSRPASSSPT